MTTFVDLARVRANAISIRTSTGVPIIGVVKANAYGLGAVAVADAINDLVDCWYVFDAEEAIRYRLWELTSKPTLCTLTGPDVPVDALKQRRIRPAVWTLGQLERFRSLDPLLCVDTGMQRFACPLEQIDPLLRVHRFSEAYTHASRPEQAIALKHALEGRPVKLHAASSSLLNDPECRLDAVRPGLALFADAVRVSLTLADARESRGPVGYTQFNARHHGVVLRGYSHGMRTGACSINGRPQQVVEVGMQSAFVTLDPADRPGDEVILLGDGLSLADAARAANSTPHETLVRLTSMGEHVYTGLPTPHSRAD